MKKSFIRTDGTERRQYFRIDDDVQLIWRRLSPEEYHRLDSDPEEAGFGDSLIAQLRALTRQGSQLLTNLRKRDPDLAHLLTLLDRKIELVAQLEERHRLGQQVQPNHRVNLSAGGIGFTAAEPLETGVPLEIRLVLFPSLAPVRALGRTVHCEVEGQGYRIGVEFTLLSEAEQEALVRHVLARQSAELRRRHEQELN